MRDRGFGSDPGLDNAVGYRRRRRHYRDWWNIALFKPEMLVECFHILTRRELAETAL